MTTAHESLSDYFTDCRTPSDADDVYKRLFDELVGESPGPGDSAYIALSEAHRYTLELLSTEQAPAQVKDDDGRLRGRVLRNWAAKEGIPLAPKGRVPVGIENLYRAAHEMPLLPVDAPPASLSDAGVDSPTIRAWAKSQDIPCGSRGRVHPDLIRKYIDSNGGAPVLDEDASAEEGRWL